MIIRDIKDFLHEMNTAYKMQKIVNEFELTVKYCLSGNEKWMNYYWGKMVNDSKQLELIKTETEFDEEKKELMKYFGNKEKLSEFEASLKPKILKKLKHEL